MDSVRSTYVPESACTERRKRTLRPNAHLVSSRSLKPLQVARHLDHMSSTAPIPSLAQPHLFPGNFVSIVNPPPYAHFPSVLDASSPPEGPERQLWDAQREAAINALEEQSKLTPFDGLTRFTPSRHAPLNADTQWQKSSHQSSALATTVLRSVHRHRSAPMIPSGLLPAPSSLANALGDATSLQQHQFAPSIHP